MTHESLSRRRLLGMAGAAAMGGAWLTAPRASAEESAATALLCRDAWGARPALPGGRPHTISRMTIHHTEVVLGDNSLITSRLRAHQRFHQDVRGWVDIAYHYAVDRNGAGLDILELEGRAKDIALGRDDRDHHHHGRD